MGGTIAKSRKYGLLDDGGAAAGPLNFLTPGQQDIFPTLGVCESVSQFSGDSTQMRPGDWSGLAQMILQHAPDYDGFVITHGTDSLAYTASALSWMLGALGKPVVLTGAQIPMRDSASLGRSDGWANLLGAVRVAGERRIAEVAVVFGSRILRGNRTTKADIFGMDAFASPNYPALGRIGFDVAYSPNYAPPHLAHLPARIPVRWPQIAAVKVFPGLESNVLRALLASGVEGCVVEAYASGYLPPELLGVLTGSGLACAVCLPGNFGPLDAFYYEPTYWIEQGAIVSARDMTREAAITKLMWALGVTDSAQEALALLTTPVAGEMQGQMRPLVERGAGKHPHQETNG
jgi:L-asparaginase